MWLPARLRRGCSRIPGFSPNPIHLLAWPQLQPERIPEPLRYSRAASGLAPTPRRRKMRATVLPVRTTSGRASGDVPPAPLSGACGRAGPGLADGIRCGHMAIVLESTNPNPNHDPAGRGYVAGVSNLDAALAQSKAAAAHIAAAAAAIRQLPNVDVVTERPVININVAGGPVGKDTVRAIGEQVRRVMACHAAVSADIRDQLNRPVREALAGLADACRRWLPKRTTVERAINSAQVSLALTAAFEQDDNVPRHTRVWQWKLPVALNVVQAEALREHIIDNGGAWMSVYEPVKPPAGRKAGHWGPALDLDGRPINVEFSSRFCTFMGVEFIVIKDKS